MFNIFIQMELIFHKINSLFISIDYLIVVGNAQQHRAQGMWHIEIYYAKIVVHKWRQNAFDFGP
jgi:hypothetical protein